MSSLYKTGYRRLYKSLLFAFGNDIRAITEGRKQLRENFYMNKDVQDPNKLALLTKDIDEIEEMLRFHIVQGVLNPEKGNFEVDFKPEHQVTIAAGQDDPHGPELSPIDPSYVGQCVTVEKTTSKKKCA